MRIGILGPLEVRDADGRSLPVGGARLRSLLIRLAIAGGDAVPVDRLAADLWPDEGPADAANAVQALVSRLRGAAGRDIVSLGPTGYRLTVPSGEIDAWAFEQAVTAARARLAGGDHAAAAEAVPRRAARCGAGPRSPTSPTPRSRRPTIARLSELRLAAAEDRIDADLALGQGAELVPEVEELAREHPLRERLRGQLMRALYAAGRQADALGVFEDTRKLLAAQLGVDPSPALSDVHLAILRAELPRSPAPVPAPAPARRRTNLPAQLTSFVGRDEDLERVASRLLAESRLVTLTGPGGAGKTRLAVETGARVADELADGVWFVPLAPVRDAIDVPQAVLTALGAWPRRPGRSRQAGRPGAAGPARRGARSAQCRPGARQLRARPRRGRRAGRAGARRRSRGADPGHQPRAARPDRRDAVPGAVAAAAARGRGRQPAREEPRGAAVRRPRGRGASGLPGRPRLGRPGRGDLPGPGRHPAGHRARGGAGARAHPASGRRAAGRQVRAALGRHPRHAAPAPDAARDRRLELGPARRRRARGAAPAVGVQRRRDARQRRARVRRSAATPRTGRTSST